MPIIRKAAAKSQQCGSWDNGFRILAGARPTAPSPAEMNVWLIPTRTGVRTVTVSGLRRRSTIAAVAAVSLMAALTTAAQAPARAAATKPTGAAATADVARTEPAFKVKPVSAEPTLGSAQLHAREQRSRVLIASDQTATSQTFANPNGSLTYVASAQPRWVARGTSWVKASARLVRGADGSWAAR